MAEGGRLNDGLWESDPLTHPVIGRAFVEQSASLITDLLALDPERATTYDRYEARAALAAPITAGDKRLGVLIVFAPRAPVFANSDLELVQLLADQAAVILESRGLIDEATRVRAREEATRLKEDFLSSAAHDLKTPLTGIVTQAQLLQRRAEVDPLAPADRAGTKRLLEQSLRLRDLVLELLDVSRLEHGSLVGERLPGDLGQLVRDLAAQHRHGWQRVKVNVDADVPVCIDPVRIEQVMINLIENGLKYSPHDRNVEVRVWRDQDSAEARLSVADHGIGIPLEDQPLIFERFHRARNVNDRNFVGMGLGLYIVHGIVEQHGGRIWVDSRPGVGSTFHVALPLAQEGVPLNVSDEKQPTATG
jgi:signal transduction histidine kinase